MLTLLLTALDDQVEAQRSPLLRLAFRPFFLGGITFAVLAILRWVLYLNGILDWSPLIPPIFWHAHEMIFGFALAIVVGFLLTAVQNWSGSPGLRGAPLAVLLVLWGVARALFWFQPKWPMALYLIPDAAVLLLAAFVLSLPIIKKRLWRNLQFIPLLLVFALLHGFTTYAIFSEKYAHASAGLNTSLWLLVLLVSVMGGRVIPFFTAGRWGVPPKSEQKIVMLCANAPIALMVPLTLFGLTPSLWMLPLLILATALHWVRTFRWWNPKNWQEPLLWSLHFGYVFLPISLTVLTVGVASTQLGSLPLLVSGAREVTHVLALGVVSSIILAMVCRVSLGHTGRPLKVNKFLAFSFAGMFFATLVRFITPVLFPSVTLYGYTLAGILFVLSFIGFIVVFGPLLTAPRADGKPG